jgi:hypothetical protein
MSRARDMLETSPRTPEFDADELVAAIEACLDCEQSCTACADADVAEPDVAEMRRCIVLCLDCADICSTTARVLSRETRHDPVLVQRLLEACVRACNSSGDECHRHAAHHAHCRVCEEVCRTCERACRTLLDAQASEELDSLRGG